MITISRGLMFIALAPILGCLLAGADRILTARLQSRVGPPLLQPYYDVMKLFSKEQLIVNKMQVVFIIGFLLSVMLTGFLFFAGYDFLLTMLIFSLSSIFLILAAYQSGSPYSFIGAERELIQVLAYEPMVLLLPVSFYLVTGSFQVEDLLKFDTPLIYSLPGVFLGFLFILTIKLRKGPFDLSYSHHAHQELVKGITTDFTGPTLALLEIAHWYENILLLGILYLFFAPWTFIAIFLVLFLYVVEIFVDNSFSRVKWELLLKSSWWSTIVFAGVNIVYLVLHKRV